MVKFKKIKSPLRIIGIQRYKSSDGRQWIKLGQGSRKPISPKWLAVGKWTTILLLVGILGVSGYRISFTYISGVMMDHLTNEMFTEEEIEEWKNDPYIQQLLAEEQDDLLQQHVKPPLRPENSVEPTNSSGAPGTGSADDVQAPSSMNGNQESENAPAEAANPAYSLQNKEQVLKLLLSKFTMAELTGLMDLAKDGLTEKEKTQIKTTLLEKLTPEEFEAIKLVALAELAQR